MRKGDGLGVKISSVDVFLSSVSGCAELQEIRRRTLRFGLCPAVDVQPPRALEVQNYILLD